MEKSILVLLEVGSVSISTILTDPTCQMVKMVSFPTNEKFWGPGPQYCKEKMVIAFTNFLFGGS
jgi:hypothetical protein